MQEPRTNFTAEELERGSTNFLKNAQIVLEYESLREERDAFVAKMDKQIRLIVRLSWLSIAASITLGLFSFWNE